MLKSSNANQGVYCFHLELQNFFGPEFVLVEKDPNLSVVNISPVSLRFSLKVTRPDEDLAVNKDYVNHDQ